MPYHRVMVSSRKEDRTINVLETGSVMKSNVSWIYGRWLKYNKWLGRRFRRKSGYIFFGRFAAGSPSQNVTFSIQPKSTTIVVNVGGNILNHVFLRDDGRLCAKSGKLLKFKFFTLRYLLTQVKFTLQKIFNLRLLAEKNYGPTKSLTEESLTLIPKHSHEIDIGLRIINQFPILYFVVFINASRIQDS